MAVNMRQRGPANAGSHSNSYTSLQNNGGIDPKYHGATEQKAALGERVYALIAVFFTAILLVVFIAAKQLPAARTDADTPATEFSEERARRHLDAITAFGPRVAGTYQNEVQTVGYLLREIEKIQRAAKPSHKIEVDVQRPTGYFTLDFLSSFTHYYDNITNIVVRLSPKKPSRHSLMINAHFDSTMGGPGASDDAASCASMLEVLRVLSQADTPLKNSIIFVLNGAEENILQASHGFITQHPWAGDIRAFVNLEAAGAGGREVVFQTGPDHPWLVRAYAEAAKYPFASVTAQELFQSNVIPSDTDFRIYRDYGNLPGIDIAYMDNGYVYHLKYDSPDQIPPGCIQRAGENLLSIVQHLVNSPYLAYPGEYRHGKTVFFDVIGQFMVVYPHHVAIIINCLAVLFTLVYFGYKLKPSRTGGSSGLLYLRQLFCAVLVLILGWITAVLTVIAVAFFMTRLERYMTWYTHTELIVGLYVCPALLVQVLLHRAAKKYFYKNIKDCWVLEELVFDSVLLFWVSLLGIMTYRGVCSAYYTLLWLVCPLLVRVTLMRPARKQQGYSKDRDSFMLYHLLGVSVPMVMTVYGVWHVFVLFIPIMGRSGSEVAPDFVVASLAVLSTIVLSCYLLSIVYISKSVKRLTFGLGAAIVVTFALAFSSYGFPYSGNRDNPTPKRLILQHYCRTTHEVTGEVSRHDCWIGLISMDYTGLTYLTPEVPEFQQAVNWPCEGPYCGVPYIFPVMSFIRSRSINHIPANELPALENPGTMKLVSRETHGGRTRLQFEVIGPSHMTLYISPKPHVYMVGWSFGEVPPPTSGLNGRQHYFVLYGRGYTAHPWHMYLEFTTAMKDPEALVEVAMSTHHFDDLGVNTDDLVRLHNSMPEWVHTKGWASNYNQWTY
ncbi:PREDICTED: endoplasmic reticulum metallopeptidase 1-like [Branchiostoma belcheri]|uniref:Endoplasmic reticulum metallopeptidase 1 n=1 Tax=Branchiostoma belcheri TaxID=7741 RepID=A0A6P4XWX7_BRABE|nr:PREDICTED: endoplasmic reticulum metallopeptidase 1-like [Branchiostoma belcheri]